MQRKLQLPLLQFIIIFILGSGSLHAQQWTKEQANEWYAKQSWVVGCNFIPSTAINQLEMWQAETFDTATIDRELGYMESIGMNTARVFLHYLVWQQDWPGFRSRMDRYLQLADRHKVKTMFVLFDDCWNTSPKLGKQPDPVPGVHNSGWMQCPGDPQYKDTKLFPSYANYTRDILTYFKNDTRILLWDLYNEAGNGWKGSSTLPLVKLAFETAFQVRPSQPISSCWWTEQGEMDDYELDHSDVLTFHLYGGLDGTRDFVNSRLKPYGRPIICTEYMARGAGSTFQNHLSYFNGENIGAINWGLVDGKTQTKFPWGSAEGAPEPNPWFHEVFHTNGKPYDEAETNLIRLYSAISKNTLQSAVVTTSENTPQTWRYTFSQPLSDWIQPSFVAAGWNTGNGPFGGNTAVKWTTPDIWLRRTFILPELSEEALTKLFLRISFDEDAEVYINGMFAAKVTRFSVGYTHFPISRAALLALKPGMENTLAVHCHQTAGGQFIDVGIMSLFEMSNYLVNTSETNGQNWLYTTSVPAVSWTELSYNDQSWTSGAGGFGTSVPNATARTVWSTPQIYMRKKFTATSELPEQLSLRIYYDEDAEVYLNGKLIWSNTGYVQAYQNIILSPEAVKAFIPNAVNILAVHCKQTAGGQYIDAGLAFVMPPKGLKDNGLGLTGQYYNGSDFNDYAMMRLDTVIRFNWGFGTPDPKVQIDNFSTRWSGWIQPAVSGLYTFYINSDNGRKLTVNNLVLIDQWKEDWNIDYSGKIFLQGGQKYPVTIEYFEKDGGAGIRFEWAQNSIPRETVPAENLIPDLTIEAPVVITSFPDRSDNTYHLYPNPTEKYFILETGADLVEQVSILDLQGVLQYSLNENYVGKRQFDVSYLTPGIYIVKINSDQKEEIKKLKIY